MVMKENKFYLTCLAKEHTNVVRDSGQFCFIHEPALPMSTAGSPPVTSRLSISVQPVSPMRHLFKQ